MHSGRTNIVLLICSLLLAVGMWSIHILSQSYHAYIPFSIRAVTDVHGYAPRSVSVQTVFLGGKASGFFLLGFNLTGKKPIEIEVEIPFQGDDFSVMSTAVSDRISESVNSYFEMTYVPETLLKFEFEPQNCKKVPVVSCVSVQCKSQYMKISDIVLQPDSVTVYGNESELGAVTCAFTKRLKVEGLKKSTGGVVPLEKDSHFRISPDEVTYSVDVARYYEYSYTVNLSTVNVPHGKNMILLPSRVDVTCRLPLSMDAAIFSENALFAVDYDDVVASRSARVAPRMENTDLEVYSCTFSPAFVEGIIMEEGK